jgi:hypothetical protein
VAWPDPSELDDSDGESTDEVPPLPSEVDDADDDPVVDVDAACAAMPATSVPARLAATNATVIMVVRVRPCSRSMEVSFLRTSRIVPGHPRPRLCRF